MEASNHSLVLEREKEDIRGEGEALESWSRGKGLHGRVEERACGRWTRKLKKRATRPEDREYVALGC